VKRSTSAPESGRTGTKAARQQRPPIVLIREQAMLLVAAIIADDATIVTDDISDFEGQILSHVFVEQKYLANLRLSLAFRTRTVYGSLRSVTCWGGIRTRRKVAVPMSILEVALTKGFIDARQVSQILRGSDVLSRCPDLVESHLKGKGRHRLNGTSLRRLLAGIPAPRPQR
jgi:hypothetical protein